MVKRVIWSSNADRIFTKILEFNIERNDSKKYSHRLNNEILSLITILSKQPFLNNTPLIYFKFQLHHPLYESSGQTFRRNVRRASQ